MAHEPFEPDRYKKTSKKAWVEIGQALKKFELKAGFVSPVETIIAAGSKP